VGTLYVLLLGICFISIIVTFESCLCNAGVFTSCYVPEEGQFFVNLQRSMLDVCTISGTIGSKQFIIQTISRKYSFQ